jgi:hypothetical protein
MAILDWSTNTSQKDQGQLMVCVNCHTPNFLDSKDSQNRKPAKGEGKFVANTFFTELLR